MVMAAPACNDPTVLFEGTKPGRQVGDFGSDERVCNGPESFDLLQEELIWGQSEDEQAKLANWAKQRRPVFLPRDAVHLSVELNQSLHLRLPGLEDRAFQLIPQEAEHARKLCQFAGSAPGHEGALVRTMQRKPWSAGTLSASRNGMAVGCQALRPSPAVPVPRGRSAPLAISEHKW